MHDPASRHIRAMRATGYDLQDAYGIDNSNHLESVAPFLAYAPHAVDVSSLRRLAIGTAWLKRVVREDEFPPFSVEDLDEDRVPIVAHAHLVADPDLIAAIVVRYARWIEAERSRPGLVVFFPRLTGREGGAVQQAARQLARPLRDIDMRAWAAEPGIRDFARVGTRGAPTALITITRT